MLASTIQFTTNPPTPTQEPPQPGAPDESGNQGALPQNPDSMPPPHTQGHPPHPTPHTSRKQKHDRRVSYTKHQTSQPPRPPPHRQETRAPAARPSVRSSPGRPRPIQRPRQQRPGSHPHTTSILRKEVIQPHLPVRLPCYDFVPIANPTFDHSPHKRG